MIQFYSDGYTLQIISESLKSIRDVGDGAIGQSFLCKHNGQSIVSPKVIEVVFIHHVTSQYRNHRDRPSHSKTNTTLILKV